MILRLLFILSLAFLTRVNAAEFFVATNGVSSGPGTIGAPWALSYALSHAGISNTITLLPGTYPSIDLDTPSLHQGLTIRSQQKWAAKILGSVGMHGVNTEPGVSNVVVDGLQIAYTYIDGIKFNDHNSVARNCWIHHSGQGGGQPQNTSGAYSGQGVAAHAKQGTVVEYCLLENNGVWFGHDHGMYLSGTNLLVRGNVCRGNVSYGIQLYENSPSGTANAQVYNNLLYNNGTYSANSGLVLYTYNGQTNYIYNNTIVETNNMALNFSGGVVFLTNNIIVSSGGSLDQRSLATTYFADYNVSTVALNTSIRGSHDVVSSSLLSGFVSTNTGRFWLKSTSPAKNAAYTGIIPPVDFWGRSQSTMADVGAFRYVAAFESDSRTLDPSDSSAGAPYWVYVATAGNLISAQVDTNGWTMSLKFSGLSPNGTFNWGWSSNNVLATSTPKLALTVLSPGYTSAGGVTTVSRTVYGTKELRLPYPNNASPDTVDSNGDCIVRVALSDYVNSGDTVTGFNLLSGAYTQTFANTADNTTTPSNLSTNVWPKVIGNWSYPDRSLVTGSSITLRCFVIHRSATGGKPVQAVTFSVTDGVTVNTATVTSCTLSTLPDATVVNEYVGTVSTAGLNNGMVTANFKAYPRLGDSTAILDTSDGVNSTVPTPLYAPQQYFLVASGAIPGSIALVSTTGNDTTGVAVTRAAFNPTIPPPAFATVAAASAAIVTNNNAQFTRNDNAVSEIQMLAGTYPFAGGSKSYGASAGAWLVIKPFTGVDRSSVIFGSQSGNFKVGDRVKFENVTIAPSGPTFWDGGKSVWFDKCVINHPQQSNAALVQNGTSANTFAWYVTHCSLLSMPQGLRPFGVQNAPLGLIRGNDMPTFGQQMIAQTVIGNYKYNIATNANFIKTENAGSLGPSTDNFIFACNRWMGLDMPSGGGGTIISLRNTTAQLHGGAWIQNVSECTGDAGSAALRIWAGDLQSADPVYNSLDMHNTDVGERYNQGYNDSGANQWWRVNWATKWNITQGHYTKDDTFNGNSGPNGARLGNWAIMWRVGAVGLVDGEVIGSSPAAGSFDPAWNGLNSFRPLASTSAFDWEGFTSFKALHSGTNAGGMGNYQLRTNSPIVLNLPQGDYALPYDIIGQPRTTTSPPGAYALTPAPVGPTPGTATMLLLWKP